MRYWLLLTLTLLLQAAAYAQLSQISGGVTDLKGEPVPGATVTLKGSSHSAATDDKGFFAFQNINHGNYTLEISSMVHAPKTLNIRVDGNNTVLTITLKEKDKRELSEVFVIGKSEKRQIEEKGFAVNVIETKGLDLQSIQTNELLDRSAGVRIRQTGGLGSPIQYNINGLSGNSIRILIDGVPIANYGESFSLNSIPAALIERIEVYKGVVPAYLADDALGGAINIILKESLQNALTTSYSMGSFHTHQWNMTGNYRDTQSKFTARASAFYNDTDNNYKVWGPKVYITDVNGKTNPVTAERFNDAYTSMGGKLDVGFTDLKWADQLMFGVVYSEMDKQVQHGATMEVVYGDRSYQQNTNLFNLTYSKRNLFVKGLDLSVFASFSNLKRNLRDTVANIYNWNGEKVNFNGKYYYHSSGAQGGNKTLQEDQEQKYMSRANLAYAINDHHKLTATYLYDHYTRNQDDPLLATFQRELTDTRYLNKNILSFSYELDAFDEKFKANLFYKYYHLNVRLKDPVSTSTRPGTAPSYEQIIIDRNLNDQGYGLALSYQLLPSLMLTASAEQAIRLPSSGELLGNNAENVNAAYNLKPENSLNTNLGVNIGPFQFNQHKLSANVNVFMRDVKDMIRQGVPSQQSETYSFENLESVTSKGFDAELKYGFRNNLQVTLNASVFNARFNTEFNQNGAAYMYYGSRLRNEPYFTHNSNVRYDFKNVLQQESRTSVYYNFAYVHHFYRDWEAYGGNNRADIPTQQLHDAGIAHTFPSRKFVLSFDAKNISNAQVFDNWALQKAGRAFYVKINYILK